MGKNSEVEELKRELAKPKNEESTVRTTILLDSDISDRLEVLAEGRRGFKTKFFNLAARKMLDELEE